MQFSYAIRGNRLIDSASIDLQDGTACLITGVENPSLALLGGIVARLFPVHEQIDVPQIQALIEMYTGELTMEDGELPVSTSYVGPDPERHLLFSKVDEEIQAQLSPSNARQLDLRSFGLDSAFLDRKIATLSGGEKMRVALALAFSSVRDCYILHGAFPWLDKAGRACIIEHIARAKQRGARVLVIEHEHDGLRDVIDRQYWFDGRTLQTMTGRSPAGGDGKLEAHAEDLRATLASGISTGATLRFEDVYLLANPSQEVTRTAPLLEGVSFEVEDRQVYALVGNNGSGKSTLAQIAFRVITPDSGRISTWGESIALQPRHLLTKRICYVGQFPEHQLTLSTLGQIKQRATKAQNTVSLALIREFLDGPDSRPVSTLSPLEVRLLCLAANVSPETRLVILDEPTWGADLEGETRIVEVLATLVRTVPCALFVISHNISFLRSLEPHFLWLHDGHIRTYKDIDALTSDRNARDSLGIRTVTAESSLRPD